MSEERCTDDELRGLAVISGCGDTNTDRIAKLAAQELLAIRAERRRDSRRAEQLKRIRWVVENQLTKIEELTKRWGDEQLAVAPPEAAP